jgi:hypothetical protein
LSSFDPVETKTQGGTRKDGEKNVPVAISVQVLLAHALHSAGDFDMSARRGIRLRSRSVRSGRGVPTPKRATRPQEQWDFGERIRAGQGSHIRNGEGVHGIEFDDGANDAARRYRPAPRGGEGNGDRGRRHATDAAYVEGRRSSGRSSSLEALQDALQKLREKMVRAPSRSMSLWRPDGEKKRQAAERPGGAIPEKKKKREMDWPIEKEEGASPLFLLRRRKTIEFQDLVANGSAEKWNSETSFWGQRTMKIHPAPNAIPVVVDVNNFIHHFLHNRLDCDGKPVTYKLGQPQFIENGCCWRVPWKSFDEALLPPTQAPGVKANWMRAWHGTKLEALYSIIYHGQLAASHKPGDRFFNGKPGVYVMKDELLNKARGYARFVPLFQDGVFWSAVWELRVNRSDRVALSCKRTDQWAQHEKSVQLAALWLLGRTNETMELGDPIAERWLPENEANPTQQQFKEA